MAVLLKVRSALRPTVRLRDSRLSLAAQTARCAEDWGWPAGPGPQRTTKGLTTSPHILFWQLADAYKLGVYSQPLLWAHTGFMDRLYKVLRRKSPSPEIRELHGPLVAFSHISLGWG